MRSLVVVLGLLFARSAAADHLSVSFTTTPNSGNFAPKNIVAVWIEDAAGNFVKTIGRWSNVRTDHLIAWVGKSGHDTDAVSGATRANHATPLTVLWDATNRAGLEVPDGTYNIRMESADDDSSQAAQNHQGTFSFVKGPTGSSHTGLADGGFIDVTVDFTSIATCNNGVLDPGETCDGNCPTTCAASTDSCVQLEMTGSPASCDAVCVSTQITQCIDGDGCCAPGCDATTDSDCSAASEQVQGGCTATPSSGGAFAVVVAMLIRGRRRRR